MERENNRFKVVMAVIATVLITFMFTTIGVFHFFINTKKGNALVFNKISNLTVSSENEDKNPEILDNIEISKTNENLSKKLEIVKAYLSNNYIGNIDTEQMNEYAIKGYVAGVSDEYTEYLVKDEFEELMTSVTGDYVGIGIYMSQDIEGNIVVVAPIKGSPAEEADLQTSDIILSIDGESCEEMDSSMAAAKIKGKEGTIVELEILRDNEKIKKSIQRRTIELEYSYSEILPGNIGYIQLSTFDNDCSKKILNYLNDFKEKKVKSVIIDLRNNTGGVVNEAIETSEIFLDKGNVIMKSYNKGNDETVIKSQENKKTNMKIVLMINEYSASATEIVAGALQDNNAATIIGTKSYGKGVMQEIIPLFDGALKVTIEEFKTPNGNKINKVGITPDIIVEDNLETEIDEQLEKAIELCK